MMNSLKGRLCLLMLCFLGAAAGAIDGQGAGGDDYRFLHKIEEDGTIRLRFMPMHRGAFYYANTTPQQLEIYGVTADAGLGASVLLRTETMQPMSQDAWRANFPTEYWDSTAFTSIYYEQLNEAFIEETFLADHYDDEPIDKGALRLGFTNFAQSRNFEITSRAGYGLAWKAEPNILRYGIKFYPTPNGDTLYHEIEVASYTPPAVPDLEAKFKDQQVKLKWSLEEFTETYFGYQLFRSKDGGINFEPVFDHALINGLDSTLNTITDNSSILSRTDPYLDQNDLEVTYRLHGADYLGGYSQNYQERTGVVGSDIELSPVMGKSIQTDSNYAVLNWAFDEDFEDNVSEFRIIHRPAIDQEYTIAISGIAPEVRQIAVPMKFRSNFYRVQAVSPQGTELSSFETLVMMYDVDPPAVPKDLDGSIDSLGIVRLSWTGSNEPDLQGYYLFKGLFRNTELAMITPDPLTEWTYMDTVSMETGNDTVFYQIRSVDIRGNGSNFTPRLALVKPDVFPPAPPQITAIKNNGKTLTLEWTTSPSPDVVAYRLYRRQFNQEEDYVLIQEWETSEYPDQYQDSLVAPGQAYGYVLQSTDDAGLISEYSQPVSATLKDFGLRAPIQNFSAAQAPDEKAITLSWEYGERPREFYLYKGTDDQPVSLLKVVNGGQREFRDEGVRKGATYRYLLRAVFPNGKVSPFTQEITIIIE